MENLEKTYLAHRDATTLAREESSLTHFRERPEELDPSSAESSEISSSSHVSSFFRTPKMPFREFSLIRFSTKFLPFSMLLIHTHEYEGSLMILGVIILVVMFLLKMILVMVIVVMMKDILLGCLVVYFEMNITLSIINNISR